VKESFEKGKKVVTFFKSSTIGHSELAKVQEDLYGNKLGMLKQECKSHHIPGPTLPTINLVDKRSLLIRSC
jgi:hypothetical protein